MSLYLIEFYGITGHIYFAWVRARDYVAARKLLPVRLGFLFQEHILVDEASSVHNLAISNPLHPTFGINLTDADLRQLRESPTLPGYPPNRLWVIAQ